jgi:hypothetical protein
MGWDLAPALDATIGRHYGTSVCVMMARTGGSML